MSLTEALLVGTAIVLVLHNAYLQVSLNHTDELLTRVILENRKLTQGLARITSALRALSDGLPK